MPKKQPSMADKKKKKKPLKQKQKQKQIVKTNVKVNVQASGGSGGGGSGGSAPAPSYIPQMFRDTSGENPRLVSLVEQIVARVPRLSVAAEAPVYNPTNDIASLNAVFNAPINTDVPEEVGGVKKTGRPRGSKNRPKIFATVVGSEADNDPETLNAIYNAPMNSNVPMELKAAGQSDEEMMRRKLMREERRSRKAFEEVNPEMMGYPSSNVPGIPSQFFNTNM